MGSSNSAAFPRLGVVGVGHLGRHHARVASDSSAPLVGVYDVDPGRAKEVASACGVRAYARLEELLSSCDAVVIATPAATHFGVARAALEAGKHCLVEKPLAAEASQADALVRLASERGLVLAVGHSERFNPALEQADRVIRDPLYVEVMRVAPFPGRGTDVDVIKDLMVHDLEIVLHWVGSSPVEMRAVGIPLVTDKVDMASVRLEFEKGQVASLTASRASPVAMRVMRVFQRGGYVSVDFGQRRLRLVRKTSEGLSEEESSAEGPEPLRAELEDFLAAIRHGTRPRVDGSEGAKVLRLAEDIGAAIHARLRMLEAQ